MQNRPDLAEKSPDHPAAFILPDARQFRAICGQFPTGVALACCHDAKGKLVGITINSFASVSLDPMIILFSIDRARRAAAIFAAADHFSINFLAGDQQFLADHFSGKKQLSSAEQSQVMGNYLLPTGKTVPICNSAPSAFICSKDSQLTKGDHDILFGRVEAGKHHQAAGMLQYWQGRYGIAQ